MLITSACLYGASHGTTDTTPKNTNREVTVKILPSNQWFTNRTYLTPNGVIQLWFRLNLLISLEKFPFNYNLFECSSL